MNFGAFTDTRLSASLYNFIKKKLADLQWSKVEAGRPESRRCESETVKVLPTGVRNQLLLNGGVRDDPQVTQEAAADRGTAAADRGTAAARQIHTVLPQKPIVRGPVRTKLQADGLTLERSPHTHLYVSIYNQLDMFTVCTHTIYTNTTHTCTVYIYACGAHSTHSS